MLFAVLSIQGIAYSLLSRELLSKLPAAKLVYFRVIYQRAKCPLASEKHQIHRNPRRSHRYHH